MKYRKISYLFGFSLLLASFYFSFAASADITGQNISFFTNPKYDYIGRTKINATLHLVSTHAYFYVEDDYFLNLSTIDQQNFNSNLNQIAQEFDNNIYPKEIAFWGSPAVLGNNDTKITILFERLTGGTGGYFDTSNVYAPNLVSASNYRQMLTITANSVFRNLKSPESLISHEFQHLISFTQKELLHSTDEDIWLNELRSEYSIDLVGYDDPYQGSTLQERLGEFLQNPSDSLTEWLNQPFDYGAINLFGQYMVEQYGPSILKESLQSSKIGIDSINDYLMKHGRQESFKDIFGNWAIANYLNNSSDPRYGYSRQDLKNFLVNPIVANFFYPFDYAYTYSLKPWQPAWYKFNLDQGIPKTKALKVEFQSATDFGLVYIDNFGAKEVVTSPLYISNIASLSSFVLSPYNRSKTSNFTSNDPTANITISISFVDATSITTVISNPLSIPDGVLIKKVGGTDFYVITGPYKRYMSPETISLYGQLDSKKTYEVTPGVFDSFPTSNYIRVVNTAGIYAVWPDNTKHLFQTNFIQSGRDPQLIFTINPLEFGIYKIGTPILR